MLETLWLKLEIENKRLSLFAFSLVFSLAVIFFTARFVPLPTGISSAFLVSLAAAYPFVRYMKHEEESESKTAKRLSESTLLKRHERELVMYMLFFTGVTFAFIISYFALGAGAFEAQMSSVNTIQNLKGEITGGAIGFSDIAANNLTVFAITFVISLLISAGMVFILVWNASVLGVFVASVSQNALAAHVNVLAYLPHGLIEIGGYILAGLSASLLAYQLDRRLRGKKYASGVFSQVIADVFVLVVVGIGMIMLGAVVEVV